MYLEKAPQGQGLYLNHTYLHLIVNTKTDDEIETGNDTTTDVYLDFTEILGNGAFVEITQTVEKDSERISAIEEGYVKNIDIPEDTENQWKTITITTVNDDVVTDSSFVVANTSYYDTVQANF